MITLGYVPFSFKVLVYLFCLWFKVRTLIYCQGSISTNASYRKALVLIQPTRNGHVDNCCNLKRKCFIIHNVFIVKPYVESWRRTIILLKCKCKDIKIAKSDLFCKIRSPDFLCNEYLIKMFRLLQSYTFEICALSKIMNSCCN